MIKRTELIVRAANSFRRATVLSVVAVTCACTGLDPQNDSTKAAPATVTDSTRGDQAKYCDAPFALSTVPSSLELLKPSAPSAPKTVTLKSSKKFTYEDSAYNLSDGCFSRKGAGCEVSDQMLFNHGGSPTALQMRGRFVVLSEDDSSKFESITFANIDSSNLKSSDGRAVSKTSLFDPPVGARVDYREDALKAGNVVLVVFEDPYYHRKYELHKFKIAEVVAGDHITFTHQPLAMADSNDTRNFICTRRAKLRAAATENSGQLTVRYKGRSSLDFDSGLDEKDREYIDSKASAQISISSSLIGENLFRQYDLSPNRTEEAINRVFLLGEKSLADVTRSDWPSDQKLAGRSDLILKENSTYLLSSTNGNRSLFVAIRVRKINLVSIELEWKRFAFEPPVRPSLELQPNTSDPKFGIATIDATGNIQDGVDGGFTGYRGFATTFQFDAKSNTFTVPTRSFPRFTGVVDLTSNYVSLEVIPRPVDAYFTGAYKASEPVRVGARYLIATENLETRTVYLIEVVGFVPGNSVTVKYLRNATYSAR